MFTFYEVGGKVRDELMGLKSKDVDYVAVPDDQMLNVINIGLLFETLKIQLENDGYEIFLVTPDCFTIRAKFPKYHRFSGTVADFVLARKEIGYKEGTREPVVVPGTLWDDLARRDFTVNAIAKAENGTLYDPFRGIEDIKSRILRTPIHGALTFDDDPLRLLRAIRFAVTKGFVLSHAVESYLTNYDYENKFAVVSEERIREELHKAFHHDTLLTLEYLNSYQNLTQYIFKRTKLWLKPTNEA